ncbi:hypothetical protein B0H15DRAFT_836727 [Mycena belliarum]|uniref:CCHC-type domain-containing protein n=1 Tax=Mycena belliarum TaxID=1033014 RepID=A0AAD6U7Y8_9AGAR|nr:hypothetical protein B0H15DRAFT_836727 [Mycena belliae]
MSLRALKSPLVLFARTHLRTIQTPSSVPPPLPTACHNCGQAGHISPYCPSPKKCRACGGDGHVASACTNPSVHTRRACSNCVFYSRP